MKPILSTPTWFGRMLGNLRRLPPKKAERENYSTGWDEHPMLTRLRIEDFPSAVGTLVQYRYWCSCGSELQDGPEGGCSVNAVCKNCKINYGNLPGFFGH